MTISFNIPLGIDDMTGDDLIAVLHIVERYSSLTPSKNIYTKLSESGVEDLRSLGGLIVKIGTTFELSARSRPNTQTTNFSIRYQHGSHRRIRRKERELGWRIRNYFFQRQSTDNL